MLPTDVKTLQSLGCYLGMFLFFGQFILRPFGVPFDRDFLILTGLLIFTPMFGTEFVIDLVKAVRGERDDSERDVDAP